MITTLGGFAIKETVKNRKRNGLNLGIIISVWIIESMMLRKLIYDVQC
jgi:hypothetical protein